MPQTAYNNTEATGGYRQMGRVWRDNKATFCQPDIQ